MKRAAVLSDVHANVQALERVLADLPSCDELYCLGDLVGYGPNPNEVVEVLRLHEPAVTLAGNHDQAVVTGDSSGFVGYAVKAIEWTRSLISKDNLDYLGTLKPSARRKFGDLDLAFFHGSPRDPLNEYVFPGTSTAILKQLIQQSQSALLLLGHTHVPMAFRDGDRMLLNPGSVGQPRDGDPRASYMILEVEDGECNHKIRRLSYDFGRTARAIIENGLPSFLGERLGLGI